MYICKTLCNIFAKLVKKYRNCKKTFNFALEINYQLSTVRHSFAVPCNLAALGITETSFTSALACSVIQLSTVRHSFAVPCNLAALGII